jgi:hypothetical protein
MDESSHDTIEIAECYFCGFRLVSDEQEEENGENSPRFPEGEAVVAGRHQQADFQADT